MTNGKLAVAGLALAMAACMGANASAQSLSLAHTDVGDVSGVASAVAGVSVKREMPYVCSMHTKKKACGRLGSR